MLFLRNWNSHLINSSGLGDSCLSPKYETSHAVFDRTQQPCAPCPGTVIWLFQGISHPDFSAHILALSIFNSCQRKALHLPLLVLSHFISPAQSLTVKSWSSPRTWLSWLSKFGLQAHNSVLKLCYAFHSIFYWTETKIKSSLNSHTPPPHTCWEISNLQRSSNNTHITLPGFTNC